MRCLERVPDRFAADADALFVILGATLTVSRRRRLVFGGLARSTLSLPAATRRARQRGRTRRRLVAR